MFHRGPSSLNLYSAPDPLRTLQYPLEFPDQCSTAAKLTSPMVNGCNVSLMDPSRLLHGGREEIFLGGDCVERAEKLVFLVGRILHFQI